MPQRPRTVTWPFADFLLPNFPAAGADCPTPLLLDAAHVLPDRDERGRPEIPTGLALCKLHYGAFDAHILGVAPDYRIAIRADVLAEIDGPMLQHGLKDMDGRRIEVPRAERLRPNRDYLAERFERFRAA